MPRNDKRDCNEVQKFAEGVSEFFGDAASKASDLALTTGGAAAVSAAVGAEPIAAGLGLASAHFAAQAGVYSFISLVADISSGQYAKAVIDKGLDAAANKVAPFLPAEARGYLAGKVGSTVEYKKCR